MVPEPLEPLWPGPSIRGAGTPRGERGPWLTVLLPAPRPASTDQRAPGTVQPPGSGPHGPLLSLCQTRCLDTHCSLPSAGPPGTTSDTNTDPPGRSRPPEIAMPKPRRGSCRGTGGRVSFGFPPGQRLPVETALPLPLPSAPPGGGGLTLQTVAVCCSQMVSSSMSSTWQKGNGDSGRGVPAHPLEYVEAPSPLGGEPRSDIPMA